ncbi:ABC transporter ATP-binding protein [Herbaspirillum sp. SJZ099]|uniref:ABC transporter ATP-binding protein n=1 Tax=Herbaspirillum sp. SJZ099 TaxID=2572916 RepID=UPI00119CBBD9|nr:ABC transporter ATP-binding protein [Herbaspirillum sp. SJZ099]TWC71468.1 iron complex transport system ATP-binding protein [Herbaspirillum sp. SJZ099]
MSAGDIVLQARQLALRVPGRSLLEDFDWQVRAGEFWCVLGRNGIGKSSLLHVAAGLLRPAQGDMLLCGSPLSSLSALQMAQHRGLLLQQQHDAFSMPVVDAVMAGRFPSGGGWADEEDTRGAALQALARVGLAHLSQADLLKLSGGERQRVGLATLLVQAPQLYLLDEPTSHQDIAAQLEMMALLRSLAGEGKAVVASCHDINLARRFASHVLLLGQQASQGKVAEVMRVDMLGEAFGCRFRSVDAGGSELFVSEAG